MTNVLTAVRLVRGSPVAALTAAVALGAGALAAAQPAAQAGPASAAGQPAWRQLFETPQTTYYVGPPAPATGPPAGDLAVSSLVAFKIPQVLNGAQVWSVISDVRVSCARHQMITRDSGLYASPMGAGKPISQSFGVDTWHAPEPGSLGELIWNTACAPK